MLFFLELSLRHAILERGEAVFSRNKNNLQIGTFYKLASLPSKRLISLKLPSVATTLPLAKNEMPRPFGGENCTCITIVSNWINIGWTTLPTEPALKQFCWS